MSGRRDELLDGAVAVLARGGSRALTHRAVEAAAGVPPGSSTNHFRSRHHLLVGVIDHLLATEMSFYRDHGESGGDLDALGRDTVTMVEYLAGPARERTTARLVLGLEAVWNAPLREPFARGRAVWRQAARQRCARIGLADADHAATALLALVDELVLDRLRDDHTVATDAAVHALLTGFRSRPGAADRGAAPV